MTTRRHLLVGATALSGLALAPLLARASPTEPNSLQNPIEVVDDCDNCHSYANAPGFEAEPSYAPFESWRGSLMANAARDPVFWAGVAIASQDHPAETVECVRCHSPRAFLEGRGDAIAIEQLEPGDLNSVECELCHRMMDDGVTPPGNARYVIDDNDVGGTVPRRGPWSYIDKDPPHPWQQDEFVGSSEMCGVCHDVTTPRERLDDQGVGLGVNFNEQRTYSEWLNSDFAPGGETPASCQDCHMPALADRAGCKQWSGQGNTHPTGFRRHDLTGVNAFVIDLLEQEYGDQGTGEIASALYEQAAARTDELLATAASLDVDAPAEVNLGEGLSLAVTVTNQSGHKLPTGYSEGRVMWLEVVARYAGETVFESGTWQPGLGPLDDAQLRTYQGVAEQWSSGTKLHLLLNDHWIEDTRIPPAGLSPDPQTDPVGDRYELQMDGTWPNFDLVDYDWAGAVVEDATPGVLDDDQLEISVRLLYLINSPAYMDFLLDENQTNDAGVEVWTKFDEAGGSPPLLLAEQQLVIDIVGFEAAGTDTGDGDTGGSTDTGDGDTGEGTGDGDGDGDTSGSTSDGDTSGTTGDGDTSGTTGDGDTAGESDVDTGADEVGEAGADEGVGDEGCSCTSDEPRGGPWLLLVPGLLLLRRRRS